MNYFYLQQKDEAIQVSRTIYVYKLPEPLKYTTEPLKYIKHSTEPLTYITRTTNTYEKKNNLSAEPLLYTKTRTHKLYNLPEPLLPTESLTRSINLYNFIAYTRSVPLIYTKVKNH